MKYARLIAGLVTLGFAVLNGGQPLLAAEPFPSKTVTIIVTQAPGGPPDLIARLAARDLTKIWSQPVVVENRPGAGGLIGLNTMMQREPDGHTVAMSPNVLNFSILTKDNTFKPRDATPISIVANGNWLLVVDPKGPVKTLPEIVAFAKANPGKLNAAAVAGSINILQAAYFYTAVLGIKVTLVPFNTGAQSVQALLGSHTDISVTAVTSSLPQVQAGRLTGIAVMSDKRDPSIPNVPTLRELGIPYEATFWQGFYGPKGMTRELANRIAGDIGKVSSQPEVVDTVSKWGVVVSLKGPAAMQKQMDEEESQFQKAKEISGLTIN